MPRFKRRPTEPIEAMQWSADCIGKTDMIEFLGEEMTDTLPPEGGKHSWDEPSQTLRLWNSEERQHIKVPDGHWIIKGLKGEMYPCSPEVFERSYAPDDDDDGMDVAEAEVVSD